MSEALIIPISQWPISRFLTAPHPESVVIPQPAFASRDALLAESANIERVVGDKSQQVAAGMLTKISAFIRQTEADRKNAKAPVLKLGTQLDMAAATFIQCLVTEESRLKTMIGGFQQEVQRKARAEEDRRRAELAELDRIQREKDMAAATEAISPTQSEELQTTIDAAATAVFERPTTVVPKTAGMSAKPIRKFRVTDIAELYRARPELVSLSERTAEINKVIRASESVVNIPGIEQYDDMAVSTRST